LVYVEVGRGAVESCRPRENRWLVGIRTKPFCVTHYLCNESFRIGETVVVESNTNMGVRIVKEGE
jgi:hypothetical protein